MKKNLSTKVGLTGIFVFIGAILLFGCKKDEQYSYDPSIADSPEMEDYIIAAADLHESLVIFQSELAKVDFSNLETVIEDGREVRYLPGSIRSLNIEQKKLLMNEKKEILLIKYPQLTDSDLNDIARYINNCANRSERVNSFLLEKGINFYLPTTRAITSESSFDNMSQLVGHLYNWCLYSNYVEVYALIFKDGTSTVVNDDTNTPLECNIQFMKNTKTGQCYFQGKEIDILAHTHNYGYLPSPLDSLRKKANDNEGLKLKYSIFYNGAFHLY